MKTLLSRSRQMLLAVAFVAMAPSCWAQTFQPDEQLGGGTGAAGLEYTGEVDGASYSYMVDADHRIVNGAVWKAGTNIGVSSDDPSKWVVLPKRDEMTDRTSWYLVHYQTGLMLGMNAAGTIRSVCLIGADFPGRPIAVRVGTAPAFQFREDCATAVPPGLRAQLMKGGSLLTRGYEWPYDFPKDQRGSADNFGRAMKLYLFLRARRATE